MTIRNQMAKSRHSLVAASFLALVLTLSCNRREGPTDAGAPVFLISIDTLRSDHLPAYGYRNGSTPAIDRFRKDAILFSHAYSHCPQTLPSHTTMMTGLLPPENGVRDNIGYVVKEADATVAQLLKANGYATGAAVSSYVLRKSTGIARGFDTFDDEMDAVNGETATSAERKGDRTREALERWLAGTKDARVFGFLHLYEPHAPYQPPPEFSQLAPYDGEIASADAIVGRFLETLRQRGLYDKALIIILSDHGEGLGEHGEEQHGTFVYRASIQVPLLVKLPRSERGGGTIAAPVGLADVAATILGFSGTSGGVPGKSLLGTDLDPAREIYSEAYFPRLHFGWHELISLIGAKYHFIEAPRQELYDQIADPSETRNLAAQERRTLAAMDSSLKAIPQHFASPSAVDPEDQRKLAALGYVGNTVGTGANLPDPKDRIQSLQLFRKSLVLFQAGNDAEAIPALEALLRQDPDMVDGWALLARSYRRVGQPAQALAALKTAMQRFPNDHNVALALADMLFAMHDYAGAKAHAQLALKGSPTLAHEALAKMALAQGDLGEGDREASAAVAESPERSASLLMLASIRKGQKRFDDELSLLDRAAAQIASRHLPQVENLQRDRGDALLELQRGPEAEEAFAAETAAFPANLQGWASLSMVRAAKGDPGAAHATIEEMLRRNQGPEAWKIAGEAYEALGDQAGAAAARRSAAGH